MQIFSTQHVNFVSGINYQKESGVSVIINQEANMTATERKWKDYIKEGLVLATTNRIKATQNPYASLNEESIDWKQLIIDSNTIYNHLVTMGMIK